MSDSFFLTALCNCFYCGENTLGFDRNEIEPLDPRWICVTASEMSCSPLAAHGRTFCDNHRVGDALPFFYFELDLRCKCTWRDLLHFLGLKFPLHLKVSWRRNIWACSHSNSFHMHLCGHSTCWECRPPTPAAAGNRPGAREQSDGAAWTFKHQSLVRDRFGKKSV